MENGEHGFKAVRWRFVARLSLMVGLLHPKTTPATLIATEEVDIWLGAPWSEA